MLYPNPYEKVLIDPMRAGANTLFIVAGYSSATFTRKHLIDISKKHTNFSLNLIIGMPSSAQADHTAFLKLNEQYGSRFNGHYIVDSPAVHCKAYGWFADDIALDGFSGSANYSQRAFTPGLQLNQMVPSCSQEIRRLYDSLIPRCTSFQDFKSSIVSETTFNLGTELAPGGVAWESEDLVRMSFLGKNGEVPQKSGLNWSKSPERASRNQDEIYLSLRLSSREEGFFPPRAYRFTLLTDDGKSFDCVIAQGDRKSLATTDDNSELGRYFRNRIGLVSGAVVTKEALAKYGRFDYTIKKINEDTFLWDFAVK